MNLKKCSKCAESKHLIDFYMRKSGPRMGEYYEKCRECMKARGVSYYLLNHERQLKLALLRRSKYRHKIRDFLISVKNKPCADCKQTYPSYVMDFDHKKGEIKEKEIGRMVAGGWSKEKIKMEIKKCDLVCANCHRLRTYKVDMLR